MAEVTLARGAARWRWRARRWMRLPGRALALTVVSAGLAGGAAAWYLAAGERLQAARERVPTASTPTQRPVVPAATRGAQVRQFIDALPPAEEAPAVVQSLIDLAGQHGVELLRGSYRMQSEPGLRFSSYRITVPLRGDPERLVQFVEAALLAWPSLAVQSMQFRRDDDGGRRLEARVEWLLHLRGDQVPAPGPGARQAGALQGTGP